MGVRQDPKTLIWTAEEKQADEALACMTAGNCLEKGTEQASTIETCHLQQRHRVVITSHYSTGFAQNFPGLSSVNEVSGITPQWLEEA